MVLWFLKALLDFLLLRVCSKCLVLGELGVLSVVITVDCVCVCFGFCCIIIEVSYIISIKLGASVFLITFAVFLLEIWVLLASFIE